MDNTKGCQACGERAHKIDRIHFLQTDTKLLQVCLPCYTTKYTGPGSEEGTDTDES